MKSKRGRTYFLSLFDQSLEKEENTACNYCLMDLRYVLYGSMRTLCNVGGGRAGECLLGSRQPAPFQIYIQWLNIRFFRMCQKWTSSKNNNKKRQTEKPTPKPNQTQTKCVVFIFLHTDYCWFAGSLPSFVSSSLPFLRLQIIFWDGDPGFPYLSFLYQDRQPELTGIAEVSRAGDCSTESFHRVSSCSLGGRLGNAKENRKKSAIIGTPDNGEIMEYSAGAHVLSVTDVHLAPFSA